MIYNKIPEVLKNNFNKFLSLYYKKPKRISNMPRLGMSSVKYDHRSNYSPAKNVEKAGQIAHNMQ